MLALYEAWSGSQDLEIHSLGLRRRGHAELLRQQASATLVDTQRLGPVAHCGVGPHEELVTGLAERFDGYRFRRGVSRIGSLVEGSTSTPNSLVAPAAGSCL